MITILSSVLVTADHSHTMSVGGWTSRFHDVTGAVEDPSGWGTLAEDGEPHSILAYGNGPGFHRFNTSGGGDWRMINRNPLDRDSAAGHR